MEMHLARHEDIAALRTLWQECFGDEESYIKAFYRDRFAKILVPTLLDAEGKIVCMIHMLPCTVKRCGAPDISAYYLYAVAASRAVRGTGAMRSLMTTLIDECKKRSRPLLLSPVNPKLIAYYESYGFRVSDSYFCGFFDRALLPSTASLAWQVCDDTDYFAARSSCLAPMNHVAFPRDGVSYALAENTFCGGVALTSSEGDCALILQEKDRLILREFCISTDDPALARARLAALCDHFGAKSCEVCTHLRLSDEMHRPPKVMAYGLSSCGYMNLLLD